MLSSKGLSSPGGNVFLTMLWVTSLIGGGLASLPEAAIAEKHIILLKKESQNWISY
jgi:hypothetical protein